MKKLPMMAACIATMGWLTFLAVGEEAESIVPLDSAAIEDEVAQIARLKAERSEETRRLHNERLNALFRRYVQHRSGGPTAEDVRDFNAMVRRHEMSTFDNFRRLMLEPVRHVTDPTTGKSVLIVGALGTDVINPWLAAAGITEGAPLQQQPMYDAATLAMREHFDFTLIGLADPNLSIDLLPAQWHDNARAAYRRLNPTNVFDGGFDHPLFYAVVREAARKMFREDHPAAKINMAELVMPQDKGGFGFASCLLCHENSPATVYRRLLGQGLFLQIRAQELQSEAPVVDAYGAARPSASAAEARQVRADAMIFLHAADLLLEAYPNEVDPDRARQSLSVLSPENLARLQPGYDQFREVLNRLECLQCHSTERKVSSSKDPGRHGAFVLNPSSYFKNRNIEQLLKVIDLERLDESLLLAKASGKATHRGRRDVLLDTVETAELRAALAQWIGAFGQPQPAASNP